MNAAGTRYNSLTVVVAVWVLWKAAAAPAQLPELLLEPLSIFWGSQWAIPWPGVKDRAAGGSVPSTTVLLVKLLRAVTVTVLK